MIKLSRTLEKVKYRNHLYYGGNQAWCSKKLMQKNGCGVVGCAQIVFHQTGTKDRILGSEEFLNLVEELRKKYLLVLPVFGLSGINMAIGMARYYKKHHMKYRVRWGTAPWKIWREVEKMLEDNIPVIISAGPTHIFLNKKYKLNLYDKKADGYITVAQTVGHYMTITEMDEKWITVSSWGQKYYINKAEYIKYVWRYSNWLVSNILVIE